MTSQINPNNIDGNYPVAGVPNNTQGMRDNFTNTKTNFQYAADEISELQVRGVFKAALTGTTLDNNMSDNLIYAVKLRDMSWTYIPITATSGSVAVDYSAGQYQSLNPTGNVSLSFTNWPVSGSAGDLYFNVIVSNVAYTLTLPAAVSLGIVGIQGISSNVITFAATGTYQFRFQTTDGGTTIMVQDINRPLLGSLGSAVGYSVGAGGTATQATDKSTAVTVDARCGQITTNSATLNAGVEVSFTLNNSYIAATDVVYVCIASGATAGAYNVQVDAVAAGSCRISIGNMSAGNLGQALVLNFVVIKSVAS